MTWCRVSQNTPRIWQSERIRKGLPVEPGTAVSTSSAFDWATLLHCNWLSEADASPKLTAYLNCHLRSATQHNPTKWKPSALVDESCIQRIIIYLGLRSLSCIFFACNIQPRCPSSVESNSRVFPLLWSCSNSSGKSVPSAKVQQPATEASLISNMTPLWMEPEISMDFFCGKKSDCLTAKRIGNGLGRRYTGIGNGLEKGATLC